MGEKPKTSHRAEKSHSQRGAAEAKAEIYIFMHGGSIKTTLHKLFTNVR